MLKGKTVESSILKKSSTKPIWKNIVLHRDGNNEASQNWDTKIDKKIENQKQNHDRYKKGDKHIKKTIAELKIPFKNQKQQKNN